MIFISAYVSEQTGYVVFIISMFWDYVTFFHQIYLSELATIIIRLGKLLNKYQNPFINISQTIRIRCVTCDESKIIVSMINVIPIRSATLKYRVQDKWGYITL